MGKRSNERRKDAMNRVDVRVYISYSVPGSTKKHIEIMDGFGLSGWIKSHDQRVSNVLIIPDIQEDDLINAKHLLDQDLDEESEDDTNDSKSGS